MPPKINTLPSGSPLASRVGNNRYQSLNSSISDSSQGGDSVDLSKFKCYPEYSKSLKVLGRLDVVSKLDSFCDNTNLLLDEYKNSIINNPEENINPENIKAGYNIKESIVNIFSTIADQVYRQLISSTSFNECYRNPNKTQEIVQISEFCNSWATPETKESYKAGIGQILNNEMKFSDKFKQIDELIFKSINHNNELKEVNLEFFNKALGELLKKRNLEETPELLKTRDSTLNSIKKLENLLDKVQNTLIELGKEDKKYEIPDDIQIYKFFLRPDVEKISENFENFIDYNVEVLGSKLPKVDKVKTDFHIKIIEKSSELNEKIFNQYEQIKRDSTNIIRQQKFDSKDYDLPFYEREINELNKLKAYSELNLVEAKKVFDNQLSDKQEFYFNALDLINLDQNLTTWFSLGNKHESREGFFSSLTKILFGPETTKPMYTKIQEFQKKIKETINNLEKYGYLDRNINKIYPQIQTQLKDLDSKITYMEGESLKLRRNSYSDSLNSSVDLRSADEYNEENLEIDEEYLEIDDENSEINKEEIYEDDNYNTTSYNQYGFKIIDDNNKTSYNRFGFKV